MARQLREVVEYDEAGNVMSVNPKRIYAQEEHFREIVGRYDWKLTPNPNAHEFIAAQLQDDEVFFFSERSKKEIPIDDVPEYIVEDVSAHPIAKTQRQFRQTRVSLVHDCGCTTKSGCAHTERIQTRDLDANQGVDLATPAPK